MIETIKLIQSHRSIRRFTTQKIDEALFEQIVLAGQAASTSSFIQAATVIRIDDADIRSAFVELSGNQKYIATAAEFLVVCADLNRNFQRVKDANPDIDYSWSEQFLTATIDGALFAQNMVIAAESEGIGCCYIGGIRNDPDRVIELLDLPDLVFPIFGLCMGYPDQDPLLKPRLPLAAVVHKNHYSYDSHQSDLIDDYDQHVQQYYVDRTSGKVDFTWSEQMQKQAQSQTRPFIKKSINNKGLCKK